MKPSGLPFISVNMAMTADGKIATANRAISTFGSRRDLTHLYELRATADAVMSGARTVEANNVVMGPGGARFERLRRRRGLARYNLRVIVSGSGSIAPAAKIFRHRFSPIIILVGGHAGERRLAKLRQVADDVVVTGRREIDFPEALRYLRSRWGVRRLHGEGGGAVNDALLRAGLVDELHLTICPFIVGGRAAPGIADGRGFPQLAQACRLNLRSLRRRGAELFLVYTVRPQRISTTS